jgi:hypothetical protein
MYFVYDLRREGFVVYTGLTTDPGRSLSRHLAQGKQFDTLHILERLPRLADAKLAAQGRRHLVQPNRGAAEAGQFGGLRTGSLAERAATAPHSRPSRYAQYGTKSRPA